MQTTHQFQLSVFLTHAYLLDSLKLSLCCKRAIVSFVLVFVQSTILSMISLSKYKWKISSMFSILLASEFGARQLILPEMVSHGIYPKWNSMAWFLQKSSSKTPSLFICTISLQLFSSNELSMS